MAGHNSTRRTVLYCAVSAAVLVAAAGARAQDNSGAATTGATARKSGELEEVVVTARRREERLQDVPVAVTAFTPERLQQAQVTTARQLVGFVPSLNISSGNQRDFQRYSIRGQGATVGSNEGVTVYFSEAPISQYIAGGPGLYFDLENLQVLNGPQGTLFGRNTTGGAVLFTPQRPTDRFEGFIQGGVGTYNDRELGGVLNFVMKPDVLRVRFAAETRKRDGFTTNIADGSQYDNINYNSLRASVLFTPTERIENSLVAQFVRSDTGGTGIVPTFINPTGLAAKTYGLANLDAVLANQQQLGVRHSQGDADHWWYTKSLVAVDTTTVRLPYNLTVKNIASYAHARVSGGFDNDGTPFPITEWVRTSDSANSSNPEARTEYLTEELQVQGAWLENRLNWVAGGFWEHWYPYGDTVANLINFGTLSPSVSYSKATTSALFAQASLDLGVFTTALDGLKFTGGYRYTWDARQQVTSSWRELGATRPCSSVTGAQFPNCAQVLNGKWTAPTYNLGLDYKPTRATLLYATLRSGYKSGGFNPNANPLIPSSYGPEKVKDYELGAKADFDVGGVPMRTDIAVFKDDYKDIQRSVFRANPLVPGQVLTFLANASAATIKGVEAQVTARPTHNLQIDLNYSYLDATYDKYLFLDAATGLITDFAGHRLPLTSQNKFGAAIKYTLPVDPSWGDLSVNGAVSYQSSFLQTDQPQPGNVIGGYTLVNLGATWKHFYGAPVDVELFATNLFDKKAVAASQVFYYAIGLTSASYIEPRMFGMRLRYNFGGES